MHQPLIDHIKRLYPQHKIVPLHAPVFDGNEKKYLLECVDTTFVSSVGAFVDSFEEHMRRLTGASHAIAVVNGTCALHMALLGVGVQAGDLVITQSLTFVATCNAIAHAGATPVFVDVDPVTMGMCPNSLRQFLQNHTHLHNGQSIFTPTGQRIRACLPMHTYGHPSAITELTALTAEAGIILVEDAAEALGSSLGDRHVGTFGKAGVFSFNGNKTITAGGGGAIVTNDAALGKRLKHLTTTAKKPHAWLFDHDDVGYNYRLPNINAALACAQFERLDAILARKRRLASNYQALCTAMGYHFMVEPAGTTSNYWLNTLRLSDKTSRDALIEAANAQGVQVRPTWTLMTDLPMYRQSFSMPTPVAKALADTLVNIPSSIDFTLEVHA